VEFAAVAPSGAVDAVRQAFGFPDRAAGQLATDVARFVDGRSALLVLDNCEHLVDEAAEICAELLAAAPTLRILATSRRSLDLPGERTWRIPPLSMPPADRTEPLEALSQYDAVTLFADRAVRSRPNFRLNADNAPAVAEIVHRLDGMPLALELAAARVRTLSPQQILNGLGDAFRLLTGGSRVLLPRQQTLETSILWSYELLDPTEQRLLRHLSAFAGSSTLDAIEAVCADGDLDVSKVLDTLDRLVDHSLVQVVDGDQHRYLLLETVRQFAARVTTSEERNALAARHATHFTAVAHDIGQLASTPALLDHVDRCLLDEPDLLKAFDWLVEHHQAQSAAAMVVALEGLLAIAGRPLTVRRMVARAATLDLAADVRAHLTFLDATAAVTAADFATAIARLDEVDTMTAESGDELNAARTDGFRRILLVGMNSEHADTLDEPIARLRAAGDHRLADRLTAGIVSLAAGRGRGEREIRARLAEAESGVAFDDPRASEMVRIAHIALAVLSCDITDVADQALAVLDRRHSFPNASACGMHLAMCLPLLPPTTADRAVALLEARARLGDQWASISLDAALSAQYVLADRHDLAWDAYSRHLGHVFVGRGSSCDAGLVAIASSGVPMHPIGNFDPTASGWGAEAARLTGDLGNAADRCHTLLATAATSDDRMTALITLDTLVAVEADAGRHRDAARLLGTVDAVMSHHRMTRPPALQRRRDRALTGMIEAEGAESVERLLLEGGSLELWAAVEYARRRRSSHTTATVGWAALTPAEAKVAALVAEGRTNPDVATALLMSPATVKTHLSRIFTKLGVSNRQELMLAAVRRRPRSPGPTSEAGGDVTQGT
jgi:predicted ATPase/DNA-binding CsgD family transcriptional regulator